MFAKLNSYKFQTNPIDHKETKLQKYLRERNEKLLEKCFNIKIERTVVKDNEPSQKLKETNNEKLSGQPNNREGYQKTCDISLITSNLQEVPAQQTPVEAVTQTESPNSSAKSKESNSGVENKMSLKSTRLLECPTINKQRSPSVQLSSNCNRSLNSKPLRTMQTKRSASSTNNWISPFNTFTTKGARSRVQRSQQSSEFSYDLSRDELKFSGPFCGPMRPAPETERQLLKSGQRREYLLQRYEHFPVVKYNYPEATSWRIGWFQQK